MFDREPRVSNQIMSLSIRSIVASALSTRKAQEGDVSRLIECRKSSPLGSCVPVDIFHRGSRTIAAQLLGARSVES